MNARITALAMAVGGIVHGVAVGQAADRPWYVGLSQEFSHESNVLGTPSGETNDTISTTTLRAGIDQPFGRQRLRADVALNHQRYRDLSDRDNNGYVGRLVLDWATVERLSGSVALNSQRRQAAFNVGGIAPVSVTNIERSDDLDFRARLGVVTLLAFEASVGHRRVTFSATEYAPREYKQDNASFGVMYRPSAIVGVSAGVSGADTQYLAPEVGQPDADRVRRREVYVGANWVPTGASTVDARLSVGKQEYDRAAVADFEGVTGSLSWAWRPSGRLALTTSLVRDSGLEAGFDVTSASAATSATDFSRVTNRLGVTATYELTGKVNLIAGLSYAQRSLVDRLSGATGRDRTTLASLGARWSATRTITLGCDASRESRSASGAGSSDMDNDRLGCFGSFTLD